MGMTQQNKGQVNHRVGHPLMEDMLFQDLGEVVQGTRNKAKKRRIKKIKVKKIKKRRKGFVISSKTIPSLVEEMP
jgi:hypothetical protein